MDERKRMTLLLVFTVLLFALIPAVSALFFDTKAVININIKTEEVPYDTSYLGILFPRAAYRWSYSDESFYASGNVVKFSTSVMQISNRLMNQEKRVAIIDVTDNESNTDILDVRFFSAEGFGMNGFFYVQKGRKYKLALYTITPDKDTNVEINISGCNNFKTYHSSKK